MVPGVWSTVGSEAVMRVRSHGPRIIGAQSEVKPLREFGVAVLGLIGAQSEVKPLHEFRVVVLGFIGAQSKVKPF